jgi:hypothetical protein
MEWNSEMASSSSILGVHNSRYNTVWSDKLVSPGGQTRSTRLTQLTMDACGDAPIVTHLNRAQYTVLI